MGPSRRALATRVMCATAPRSLVGARAVEGVAWPRANPVPARNPPEESRGAGAAGKEGPRRDQGTETLGGKWAYCCRPYAEGEAEGGGEVYHPDWNGRPHPCLRGTGRPLSYPSARMGTGGHLEHGGQVWVGDASRCAQRVQHRKDSLQRLRYPRGLPCPQHLWPHSAPHGEVHGKGKAHGPGWWKALAMGLMSVSGPADPHTPTRPHPHRWRRQVLHPGEWKGWRQRPGQGPGPRRQNGHVQGAGRAALSPPPPAPHPAARGGSWYPLSVTLPWTPGEVGPDGVAWLAQAPPRSLVLPLTPELRDEEASPPATKAKAKPGKPTLPKTAPAAARVAEYETAALVDRLKAPLPPFLSPSPCLP
jgi:hypothetical protein